MSGVLVDTSFWVAHFRQADPRLQALQQSAPVTPEETLRFIAKHRLHDSGCGAIDLCLLASARMTPHTTLWTLDRNLAGLARRLGVSFQPAGS